MQEKVEEIKEFIEKQNKELEDYKSRKIYQAHLIEIANKDEEIKQLKEKIEDLEASLFEAEEWMEIL